MTVDEKPWVKQCPKCGKTDNASQVPVTRGAPCEHCGNVPFKRVDGLEFIMFYMCLACQTRYLIPKLEPEEIEYRLFSHTG